jgi:hypothetical protein
VKGIPQGHQYGQEPAADAVADEESKTIDQPADVPTEHPMRSPGFARMRLDWRSEDRPVIQRAKAAVEGKILMEFPDAFEVMNEILEAVRTPEVDEITGEIKRNQHGFVIWKRLPNGQFDEDFTRLSRTQREHLLFAITHRLFDWDQRAADIRMEATMARGQFEEQFAIGFDAPVTGTVDDRRAAGNLEAREERYFAIYLSALSHRADALVKAMERLGQRLKDSLTGYQ